MRTFSVGSVFCGALLVGLAPSGRGATVDEGRIARLAEEVVDAGLVPGISISVRSPGSNVVVTRGVADRRTGAGMNVANAQRIGSVTKSFTVTRLLQLVDEGRVSLDDPIDRYVKGLRNGDATLRELANMTSGIFNYTEDGAFITEFVADLTRRWTDREIVDMANANKPYFRPGRGWHYSNTATILLGMVVERVTGNRLGPEIMRSLVEPLGLRRTSYPTGVFLTAPFTHGYAVLDADEGARDVTVLSPSGLSGAGAIVSTAGDLLVWGRALARGSLVSRESQLARLQMVPADGEGPFYNQYGLGMGRINGWMGHTAEVLGYQSLVMHNLVADMTVVVLVNGSGPVHVPTAVFQKMTAILPRALPAKRTTLRVRGARNRVAPGARVVLRGRAASPAGILLVEGRNRRAVQTARGAESWRLSAKVRPGRNVVRVQAYDRLGRPSKRVRVVVNR